jgi:hypothetical protein
MADFTYEELIDSEAFKNATPEVQARAERTYVIDALKAKVSNSDYILGSDEYKEKMDDEFSARYQSGQEVQDSATRENNIATKGNFERGFDSAAHSLKGTTAMFGGLIGGTILDKLGDGLDSEKLKEKANILKENAYEYAQKQQRLASLNPIDVQNFTDIRTDEGMDTMLSDAGKYVIGSFGELTPSLIESAASAAAGSLIGGAVGGIAGAVGKKVVIKTAEQALKSQLKKQAVKTISKKIGGNLGVVIGTMAPEGGGMMLNAADNHGLDNVQLAPIIGLSAASGVSELVSPSGIIAKKLARVPGGNKLKEVTDTNIPGSNKLKTVIDNNFLPRMGVELINSSIKEYGQEAFQEALSKVSEKVHDPEVSLIDEKARRDYFNAGMKGAVGGLAFGSANVITSGKRQTTLDKARASTEYKRNIESIIETEDISPYIDNPILAVDGLAAINNKEGVTEATKINNQDMANDIYKRLNDELATTIKTHDDLIIETKTNRTSENIAELKRLRKQRDILTETRNKIIPVIEGMNIIESDIAEDTKTNLATAITNNDSDSIIENIHIIFGSKGGNRIKDTIDLDTLVSNTNLSSEVRELAKDIQELDIFRDEVNERTIKNKDISEVQNNIFVGNVGFKGIDTYHQRITKLLVEGNIEEADKQLVGLTTFARGHQAKAITLNNVLKAVTNGTPLAAEDQIYFDQINEKRVKNGLKPYEIRPGYSNNMVANMQVEANALTRAVTTAHNLYKSIGAEVKMPLRDVDTNTQEVPVETPVMTTTEQTEINDTQLTEDDLEANTPNIDTIVDDVESDNIDTITNRDINNIESGNTNTITDDAKSDETNNENKTSPPIEDDVKSDETNNENKTSPLTPTEDGTINTESTDNKQLTPPFTKEELKGIVIELKDNKQLKGDEIFNELSEIDETLSVYEEIKSKLELCIGS